jgi:mono/diheme cytochrome c family protein
MRTHPLIALAVAAAAITTVAVFGQSAPPAPVVASKPHHANPALDAKPSAAAASTAVPAWLAPVAASAPPAARAVAPAAAAVIRPDAAASPVERGRYLAAAGDCAGCHTLQGGAPYAGGRPLETPFGTVLSANLTPDATGLKGWTADQFYRAMHEGISANGDHLYPAFPYNYFTRMPRTDTDALFAYLQSLAPVANKPDRNQLPFPFNIRALMSVWNLLYLDKKTFAPDPAHNAQWNRGAYLVEGPGHCAACHTPKTILGGPQTGHDFHGGSFGTWFAPDLTPNSRTGLAGWTRDETVAFLKTGRNAHASASGEMGLVVQDSTSKLADDDLQAIVAYLADRVASPAPSMIAPDAGVMKTGEAIFVDECSACHLMQGQGQTLAFPPLAHSANLQQIDPTTSLHLILAGVQAAPTGAAPTPFTMPAFNWKLNDQQAAAVATYVRNSWGNSAPAVQPDQVAKLRAKLVFDAMASGHTKATPLGRPGPNTLGQPDTDSRDNGTPQAGRAAPTADAAPASAASSGASTPQGEPVGPAASTPAPSAPTR